MKNPRNPYQDKIPEPVDPNNSFPYSCVYKGRIHRVTILGWILAPSVRSDISSTAIRLNLAQINQLRRKAGSTTTAEEVLESMCRIE